MRGTYLNTATVVAGTLAGMGLRSVLPPHYGDPVKDVIAVATAAMGVRMFLKTQSPVVPVVSALVGLLIGQAIGIEAGLVWLGKWFQGVFDAGSGGTFALGFVTTSILYCAGPMTVLGCIEDGIEGKSPLLLVKSTFDGISAVFFAAALGWGVLLSAGTVLVVQGTLTLLARPLSRVTKAPGRVEELTACGGIMLIALSLRILGLKPGLPVGNILPGLALAPIAVALLSRRKWYP